MSLSAGAYVESNVNCGAGSLGLCVCMNWQVGCVAIMLVNQTSSGQACTAPLRHSELATFATCSEVLGPVLGAPSCFYCHGPQLDCGGNSSPPDQSLT